MVLLKVDEGRKFICMVKFPKHFYLNKKRERFYMEQKFIIFTLFAFCNVYFIFHLTVVASSVLTVHSGKKWKRRKQTDGFSFPFYFSDILFLFSLNTTLLLGTERRVCIELRGGLAYLVVKFRLLTLWYFQTPIKRCKVVRENLCFCEICACMAWLWWWYLLTKPGFQLD